MLTRPEEERHAMGAELAADGSRAHALRVLHIRNPGGHQLAQLASADPGRRTSAADMERSKGHDAPSAA